MAREKCWSTQALCDALCEAKNLNTDYKLAKFLGMHQSTVSLWRRGATVMSDDWGKKIAAELQIDPAYVCLCLAAERSPDANLASQMRAWLTQHASAAVLVFAVFSVLSPASAAVNHSPIADANDSNACILCKIFEAFFATVTGRFLSALPTVGTVVDRRPSCAAYRHINSQGRLATTA